MAVLWPAPFVIAPVCVRAQLFRERIQSGSFGLCWTRSNTPAGADWLIA